MLFKKFSNIIFLLDKPESSLSPQNQLSLMRIIHKLEKSGSQLIIITHSPILMSYPKAQLLEIKDEKVMSINSVAETTHYSITKPILNNSERVYKHLFVNDEDNHESDD